MGNSNYILPVVGQLQEKLAELQQHINEGRASAPGVGSIWTEWKLDALVLRVTRSTCRCCGAVHTLPGKLYVRMISGGLHFAGKVQSMPLENVAVRFARAFQCSTEEAMAVHMPELPHKVKYLDSWVDVCHSCWADDDMRDLSTVHAGLPRRGPRLKHPPMLPVALPSRPAPVASPNPEKFHKPKSTSRRAKPRQARGVVKPATDKDLF
jgi:hypothetical protein